MSSKRCVRCGLHKTLDSFTVDHQASDGLRSYCRPCTSEYHKAWRAANPDYDRNWRKANPEAALLRDARTRKQRDPDKRRAYDRRWRATNPASGAASNQRWNTNHPDRRYASSARYALLHPDTVEKGRRTRRARRLGLFVESVDRKIVWVGDQGICGICRLAASISNWEVDHIVPFARGGPESYSNVRVSHRACNRWKCDRLDEELPPIPSYVLVKARLEAGAK